MIEHRSLGRRLKMLVWECDPTQTEFVLAITAMMAAVTTAIDRDDCSFQGCLFLHRVMPWEAWTVAWALYAALKLWRIFDGVSRPLTALCVNIFGAMLYCASAYTLTLAQWPILTLSALAISFAFASLWVLLRTGINAGIGFRCD